MFCGFGLEALERQVPFDFDILNKDVIRIQSEDREKMELAQKTAQEQQHKKKGMRLSG